MPPIERAEVTEETKLEDLCDEERYSERGDFERSLAECFKGLDVRALKGFTEETLMAFVAGKGGPHGFVPGWLKEKGLRRFLDEYVSPIITKKAKDGDNSSSNSSASPSKRPS